MLSEPADSVSGIWVPVSFLSSIASFLLGADIPLTSIPMHFLIRAVRAGATYARCNCWPNRLLGGLWVCVYPLWNIPGGCTRHPAGSKPNFEREWKWKWRIPLCRFSKQCESYLFIYFNFIPSASVTVPSPFSSSFSLAHVCFRPSRCPSSPAQLSPAMAFCVSDEETTPSFLNRGSCC
jgi:hypothetical protein